MNILHFLALISLLLVLAPAHGEEPAFPASRADAPERSRSFCTSIFLAKPKAQRPQTRRDLPRELGRQGWREIAASAASAAYAGKEQLAADLGLHAICSDDQDNRRPSDALVLYAACAESLLDVDQVEIASSVLDLARASVNDTELPNKIRLPLKLAFARLLAFRGDNVEALRQRKGLQQEIDATYGFQSTDSLLNGIRIEGLKMALGQVDESLKGLMAIRDAIPSMERVAPPVRSTLVRSVASALSLLGREREALDALQAVRADFRRDFGPEDARVIKIERSISEILTRIDPGDIALEMASHVFLWQDANSGLSDSQLLRSLWQLAYLYSENGRPDTSRSILAFLLRKTDASNTRASQELSLQARSLVASLDNAQGDYANALREARKVYEEAIDIYGKESVDTQIAAANLAVVEKYSGETQAGCALLQQIQSNIEFVRPSDTWTVEFARMALSDCFLRRDLDDRPDSILDEVRHSWRLIASHSSASSRDSLNALSEYAAACSHIKRGCDAKALLGLYVQLIEKARKSASEGSALRLSAITGWFFAASPETSALSNYRRLALLHAQDNELESALRVSELARDRTLGDRFAEQEWLRTALAAGDRSELEALGERIQSLDERLAVSGDIIERVRLESERTLVVAERGRRERQLREQRHLAAPHSTPPTLDALRAHLASDTALVSVVHSGQTWWALVVSRDAPARFLMFADPDLGRNAAAWVRRLRGEPVRAWPDADGGLIVDALRPARAAGDYLSTQQLAERLGRSLLQPLVEAVGPARRLLFVGDDELVGVPLQALPLGRGLALDRFDISYAPSLTTYARWQARPARRAFARDLLAVGVADFPHRSGPQSDDPVAAQLDYAADHPLPYAGAEVASIAALFPAQRQRSLVGVDAHKAVLRAASQSGELAGYRYVHLATHAWADNDQPEGSAVVLASAGSELPLQVVLTAAELAGLRMDSDLVVLSACETGAGRFEHGRGLLGLAYAALAAGNRAAVLSLWPIADDTTAPFMAQFYARLRRGADPVAALSATQRAFRDSGDARRADPATWAPFVLYGSY